MKTLEPDAPQLHDDIDGNLCVHWELGDGEATEAELKAATCCLIELHNNRVTAAPIEPRGTLVVPTLKPALRPFIRRRRIFMVARRLAILNLENFSSSRGAGCGRRFRGQE